MMEDALEEVGNEIEKPPEEDLAVRMSKIVVDTSDKGPPRLDDLIIAALKRSR